MDELAVDPSVRATAVDLLLFYDTLDIVAELGDDLVVIAEQRHARMQFWDEEDNCYVYFNSRTKETTKEKKSH